MSRCKKGPSIIVVVEDVVVITVIVVTHFLNAQVNLKGKKQHFKNTEYYLRK